MFCVTISSSSSLLYYPSQTPSKHHIAFRVDKESFMKIMERMRQRNILFGNDPEEFNKNIADVGALKEEFTFATRTATSSK